jgi:NCAIR mutase (PurE)-related protein
MRKILEDLKSGKTTVAAAEQQLREHFVDVYGIARLDLGRDHRTGIPEVVIAQDKTDKQIIQISAEMLSKIGRVIITRLTPERAKKLQKNTAKNEVFKKSNLVYHDEAQICIIRAQKFKINHTGGKVGVVTAGTSDIPVAEEAKLIVEELGCDVFTAYDIGVSGAHRLVEPLKRMVKENVDVLIVMAGREGALPTLIAGIVDIPVIGVPISTGYGLEGKGKTALYAMLQSCSPLVVVNIDAGFVAGAVAARIATRANNAHK